MGLETWSPYARFCSESVLIGPFSLHERVIYDYELIWLEKGTWTAWIDGEKYICQEGSMLLLRPGHRHSFHIETGVTVSQPHVHFDLEYSAPREQVPVSFLPFDAMSREEREQILPDDLLPKEIPAVFTPSRSSLLPILLRQLVDCQKQNNPLYILESRQLLLQLLIALLREFSAVRISAESVNYGSQMPVVKNYIDHNYMHPITLDNLSGLFFIDKYYLTRLFKQYYGVSAIEYFHKVRMNHAKELLRQGNSVTEVSQKLGFDSIYSFSRAFLNATGIRPSVYALRGREREDEQL